uniref:F-box associated domain-containing protein n=1 Tax=Aegilops tauschii TaxID=37682 RepID=M8CS08_AEGTA
MEILVRLQARYIVGRRAVCRAWRSAIPHPNFDRAHARRPTAVAKVAAHDEFSYYGLEGNMLLHRLGTRVIVFDFSRIGRQRTPFPRAILFTSALSTMVMGSWDGVVCLERGEWPPHPRDRIHLRVHQYVLWNPLSMACGTVGPPPAREGCIIGGYAHPETRRFHLLHDSGTGRCFLLRIGDAVWREISFLEESSAHADAAPPRILMSRHPHCFVRLHDNLHWLVQSMGPETSSTPRLLAFDTTREKFWWMETPERHGRPFYVMTTRISALPCGKLGVFSVDLCSRTMELWVLDDYSGGPRARGSWRLKERISLINWDGSDLSCTFLTDSPLEAVEDAEEGEELLLKQLDGRIDAYNIRRKAWRPMDRATLFVAGEYMVMHRESVLQDQASFGNAALPLLQVALYAETTDKSETLNIVQKDHSSALI